jgi:uncharacterized protein with ATP-grasp and redox domains
MSIVPDEGGTTGSSSPLVPGKNVKFPPPLCAADGGFTRDSLVVRLPNILRETLSSASAPPALVRAVHEQLIEPLSAGVLLPAPANDAARLWRDDSFEFQSSWFYQEVVAYVHLMRLWGEHGLAGEDPFASQKTRALESAEAAFLSTIVPLAGGDGKPTNELVAAALVRSLWGNRADLSLSAGRIERVAAGAADDVLVDELDAAFDVLLAERSSGGGGSASEITIVLDNCGLELLSDLALTDVLLRLGHRVTLHCKAEPTFVSDALEADILATISFISQRAASAPLADRLLSALSDGSLQITAHRFWNCALPGWCMPSDLRDALSRSSLAIFKGDANYRRLLGDRHWPHDTPFDFIVGAYAPCPILALRTLKAGLIAGLPREVEARVAGADDWLVSGRYGVMQFAAPAK